MKILALVIARGGSKRLPGKNIRLLGGKPLISWSIDLAKDIAEISAVMVSTDDSAIAHEAKNSGAIVPWLRPAELASDKASPVDVAIHALDWYEHENGKVDGLLLLQPTSPFRTRETILRGIKIFCEHESCSVIGVAPAESHPMWCFKICEKKMTPFLEGGGQHLRSQDLPPAYIVNGALYLISPTELRRNRAFSCEGSLPLIIDKP